MKTGHLGLILTFLLLIVSTPSAAARLDFRWDRENGHIGDTFLLLVSANPEPGEEVVALEYEWKSDWETVSVRRTRTAEGFFDTVTVIVFGLGELPGPEITVRVLNTVSGRDDTAAFKTPPVRIESLLDVKDDRDVPDPHRPPVSIRRRYGTFLTNLVKWGGVIIAILLLLAGVLNWLKRRLQRYRKEVIIPRSAYQVVMDRIRELRREDYPGKGEIKLHYMEGLRAVREYLSAILGRPLLAETMEETVKELNGVINEAAFHALIELYREAERVKFASYVPEPEKIRRFLDAIEEWVIEFHRTRKEGTE